MIQGDGMDLDEETLNQMLGVSTVPEERKALQKQALMAQLLGQRATAYNQHLGAGRGAQSAIGGLAGAVGQGLQGYASNKMRNEGASAETGLQGRERQAREAFFRARYGQGKPGGGAQAATPMGMHDPGQPEVSILPPDDEFPYG